MEEAWIEAPLISLRTAIYRVFQLRQNKKSIAVKNIHNSAIVASVLF
jgi:hypothetical protein